jgi:hypothetical protein
MKCLSCTKEVFVVTDTDTKAAKSIIPGGLDIVGMYISRDWYAKSNINDWIKDKKAEITRSNRKLQDKFTIVTGGTDGTEYFTLGSDLTKTEPTLFDNIKLSKNPNDNSECELFYTAYIEGEWSLDSIPQLITDLSNPNTIQYEIDERIIQKDETILGILSKQTTIKKDKKKKNTLGDVRHSQEQNAFTFAFQTQQFRIYLKEQCKPLSFKVKQEQDCIVQVNALCYIPKSLSDQINVCELLTSTLQTRLEYIKDQVNKPIPLTLRVNQGPQMVTPISISSHVFLPDKYPHAFCLSYAWYDATGDRDEETLQNHTISEREKLHDRFYFTTSKPFLRAQNAINMSNTAQDDTSGTKLRNVHKHVGAATGVDGGKIHLVNGDYTYYHYLQDGFSDSGWGCAYRSLQTLISHAQSVGLATCSIPTHKEIQQTLVECGDKPSSFIDSETWIGAFELSLVIRKWCGLSCRVLNVSSGRDMDDHARQLAAHFDQHGTPVMIGGGVLAYTLLGVCFNESTGAVSYLILDPHYTGKDEIGPIIKGNWCAWKKREKVFLNNEFYNLCMPLIPRGC